MAKVLISDKMHPKAAEIFQNNGIDVDVRPGMSAEDLNGIIGDYDGLAVRSSTKVLPEVLGIAKNLKVIGRAGIGVDNIDVNAATEAGIVVMNTPFGNSITTAEHSIAMMFSLARQIPQANKSTHEGKWEKSKFMGVELYGKTLGIIGCGNIGSIVASRALGLQMNVIAFDPFLTPERAEELGVEHADLDTVLAKADFITLHVPKNEKTAGLINAEAIKKMKQGVRIINCARGGIVIEADLKEALDSGHVAGAALDVYEQEPAKENILFDHPNVICTPHLGASTAEAQVNVAIQVAEQMSDFLLNGAVSNALNMPSVSAEEAPRLKPYLKLTEQLGSFAGQINNDPIKRIEIEYQGHMEDINTKPLTAMALAGVLKVSLDTVNIVNASQVAKARGIVVSETRTVKCDDFHTAVKITLTTEKQARYVTGTLFAGKEPRVVDVEGVPVEAALTKDMLFIRNENKPGLIGKLGTILGNANQNISDFRLGQLPDKDTAIALVSLDQPLPDDIFKKISNEDLVVQAQRMTF
jgi:D-3-phosphoglycerate dehydrogenase